MEDICITETESRYFGDLFLCCDVEKTGRIPFLKATELFRSANLSNDVIRQITTISGIPQTAIHISRSQFYSCLKLIAAHQASVPLRPELITSSITLPLPRFSWKDSPPLSRAVSNVSSNLTTASSSGGLVASEANGLKTVPHSSQDSRQWREVRSPDFIDLSSGPRNSQQETTNSDLQSTDSEVEHNEATSGRVNRRHRNGSPEAWSTNSDSPTPTNSVAERPWAKDTLWQGLLGDEHRQLLGTEEESSDRHSSDDDNEHDLESVYQITNEQREYYTKQFKAVQPDPNGLLSGHIARVFFEKSRIPVEELRHIWQLCDVTRDGALSLAEFTAAMHLVVLRRNNIPLPSVLPSSLNPSILNQQMQPTEPAEADLLHLDDDKGETVSASTNSAKDSDFKGIVTVLPEKNLMALSSVGSTSSQPSVGSKGSSKATSSPIRSSSHKNRSVSNSPHGASAMTPPNIKVKDVTKDWVNQNREWTKFTESPTSSVSSPGPKPVNFDMQRTAQAVVSDPQILHPVPLRVTPVGAEVNEDDSSVQRIQRKSETIPHEINAGGCVLRETESSPKLQGAQYPPQAQHRDSLQGVDLRAIQRPQPKKLPPKNIGAIPPPPQRESLPGIDSKDIIPENGNNINLINKKEPPPLPPPRPHRHARSSSLDLNKLKMGGTPPQSEMISQNSFDVQGDSVTNYGFADFTQFHDPTSKGHHDSLLSTNVTSLNADNSCIPPQPRPTISSLQTSQRVSAFEVYRKPNTPRTSQSPEHSIAHLASSNNTSSISISSGADYERRVTAISENLRHVNFKHDKNLPDVLKHLKEQNLLLLRLCNNLSEELRTIQQRKEEIRGKLESTEAVGTGTATNAEESLNVISNTANNIVHSNV